MEEKIKNYDDYVLFYYLLFIEYIAGLHNAQYANICIEQRTTSGEVFTYTVLSLWVMTLWFCVDVFVQIFCPEQYQYLRYCAFLRQLYPNVVGGKKDK